MSDPATCKIPPLVHMPAGYEANIGHAQHFDQPLASGHRNVADCRGLQLRIVGRVQKQRLVQKQRDRFTVGAGELCGEPLELLRLYDHSRVHDQRIEADKTPAGSLKPPAVLAERGDEGLPAVFVDDLRRHRPGLGRIVTDVVIAGEIAAGNGQ